MSQKPSFSRFVIQEKWHIIILKLPVLPQSQNHLFLLHYRTQFKEGYS